MGKKSKKMEKKVKKMEKKDGKKKEKDGKRYSMKIVTKKQRVTIIIIDKEFINKKKFIKDKKGHHILIKVSV